MTSSSYLIRYPRHIRTEEYTSFWLILKFWSFIRTKQNYLEANKSRCARFFFQSPNMEISNPFSIMLLFKVTFINPYTICMTWEKMKYRPSSTSNLDRQIKQHSPFKTLTFQTFFKLISFNNIMKKSTSLELLHYWKTQNLENSSTSYFECKICVKNSSIRNSSFHRKYLHLVYIVFQKRFRINTFTQV